MNRKARLDRALANAERLAEAKRVRANPLLAVAWLPEARQRALQVLERIVFNVGDDACPADVDAMSDRVFEVIKAMWQNVLNASGCPRESFYVRWQVALFSPFADILKLVPDQLVDPFITHILAAVRGTKDSIIHTWMMALADGDVAFPEASSVEAMGVLVKAVLEHERELDGHFAYCAKCRLPCLQHRMTAYPCKGCWFDTCPNCGEPSSTSVYRFE